MIAVFMLFVCPPFDQSTLLTKALVLKDKIAVDPTQIPPGPDIVMLGVFSNNIHTASAFPCP